MTNHEAISDHESVCQDLASNALRGSIALPDYSTGVCGSYSVYFYVTDNGDREFGSPWRFWMVSCEGVKEFTP